MSLLGKIKKTIQDKPILSAVIFATAGAGVGALIAYKYDLRYHNKFVAALTLEDLDRIDDGMIAHFDFGVYGQLSMTTCAQMDHLRKLAMMAVKNGDAGL